ncbi:hypothetical protein CRG98_024610 [Punica granatum]|uniref:Uncharacterized protein n=1 Tax=Punica granatum TaxID=22663 RepID=A0A2I0JGH7_PUNGR|nr:hypothetical protein CRG98_024610 [Punica granatum]
MERQVRGAPWVCTGTEYTRNWSKPLCYGKVRIARIENKVKLLISELLLALLFFFPSSSFLSLTSDESTDSLFTALLPIIRQFASIHEDAASILLASRKRKRAAQLHEPDLGSHAFLARGGDFSNPNRSLN